MAGGNEVLTQILKEASRVYRGVPGDDDDDDDDLPDGYGNDLASHVEYLQKEDAFTKTMPKSIRDHAASMRPPRDRVTCLLVGNHSAGKSSFINWYIGDKVQSESVAMETAGFTIIRKGLKRATWKGHQTLTAFPHLAKFGQFDGVVDFLTTEFTTSTQRDNQTVEFIDTPGLTDGTLKYPFPIEDAICELADHANLILVFLDPIGKALVERTMKLVQRLSQNHTSKMLFCLTKFDTAGDQVDRTNVVSQIVQELQGRVKVTHAIKLHTIFLPERGRGDTAKGCPNKIEDLCQAISNEVQSRVQTVLDQLVRDCKTVTEMVHLKLLAQRRAVKHNFRASVFSALLPLLTLPLVLAIGYWVLINMGGVDPLLFCDDAHPRTVKLLRPTDKGMETVWEERLEPTWNIVCSAYTWLRGTPLLVLLIAALSASTTLHITLTKRLPQLTPVEVRALKHINDRVEGDVLASQKALVKKLKRHAMDDDFL